MQSFPRIKNRFVCLTFSGAGTRGPLRQTGVQAIAYIYSLRVDVDLFPEFFMISKVEVRTWNRSRVAACLWVMIMLHGPGLSLKSAG